MRTTLLRNMSAAIAALFIALFSLPVAAQAQTKEAYVVCSTDGTSLTFYFDGQRASRSGTTYGIGDKRTDDNSVPAWAGAFESPNSSVKQAVFDASFRDYKPTTTSQWFAYLQTLANIAGMENLNTSKVTRMDGMFGGCSSLTSLDVSNFNTSKVTRMGGMFYGCSSLTSLDVSNFNTSKVTNMSAMFAGCSSLTTIHCNDNWQSSLLNSSSGMFNGCTQLKGTVAYDADKIDAAMANPETGYFTRNGSNGIAAPEAEAAARRKGICTLSGVKMQGTFGSQPAGVYIVNGRKVVKR